MSDRLEALRRGDHSYLLADMKRHGIDVLHHGRVARIILEYTGGKDDE